MNQKISPRGNQHYKISSLAEKPHLLEKCKEINNSIIQNSKRATTGSIPAYEMKSEASMKYWDEIFVEFPEYQVLLYDSKKEPEVIAVGHTVPFSWNGESEGLPEGWDGVLETAVTEKRKGITPNTLSALFVMVNPDYQRKGYSVVILKAMKQVCFQNNLKWFIVPVRPMLKVCYPLISIHDYVNWRVPSKSNPKELVAYDPWLRLHYKLGAKFLKVATKSVVVRASIQDWEEWTGLKFFCSSDFVIPGALSTVHFDLEKNEGVYYEPNIWVKYSLESSVCL